MADTFRAGVRVVRSRPMLLSILAIGLFFGLYSEAWDRLWQFHLMENIGLPTFLNLQPIVWIGAIDVVLSFVGIGAAEIMKRRLNMNSSKAMSRALFWMTAVMIGGLIVYGLSTNFVVALAAFFAFSTARGLTDPVYRAWSNQHIDSQVRATVLSMQSQTDAIGQIVGGPPLGALGQIATPLAFMASAGILSPALWLLRRAQGQLETTVAEVPEVAAAD
jgi:DHA3 family tetracycline resistance protein-like MFS transporter